MTTPKKQTDKINLAHLTEKIVDNIDIVLNSLGIPDYNTYTNRVTFPCPIHGGDNPEGCCIFTDGTDKVGNWVCWTHACHEDNNSLIEFIRLVLSDKKETSFSDAIKWCQQLLNCDIKDLSDLENLDFIRLNRKANAKKVKLVGTKTREEIRKFLDIPAKYYIDGLIEQGKIPYSKEILDKYDIGLCRVKKSSMYLRVVSPVYDDNFRFLGCCGRTTQPKCDKCGYYHYSNRNCPSNDIEKIWGAKWRNSKGRFAGYTFYNSWYAIPHIFKTGTLILTEGCGDVWRLEESGIHIGLGMFKTVTAPGQDEILKKYPISNIIIANDGDKAGKKGSKKLLEKYSRYYNVYEVDLEGDIGDSSVEQVKDIFYPLLDKLGAR